MIGLKKISAAVAISLLFSIALHAQFYKVYGYQPVEAGELESVIWNSSIPSSNLSYNYFSNEISREGLLAHSIELEYGLSNTFGVVLYFDFEDPKRGDLEFPWSPYRKKPRDSNDKYFITTNEKVAYPTHSKYRNNR